MASAIIGHKNRISSKKEDLLTKEHLRGLDGDMEGVTEDSKLFEMREYAEKRFGFGMVKDRTRAEFQE